MKYMMLFCLLLAAIVDVSAQSARQKPNIIYIYADDMGYGELGSYG